MCPASRSLPPAGAPRVDAVLTPRRPLPPRLPRGPQNVHLLTPGGQFGTRRMGGKDHASARYVFTKLEKITRAIFHPDDDDLLHYLNDDGLSIEPEHYMPVIPMVLVNGSDGIGTGWSSTVQKYDPREIVANLRRMIRGEEPEAMHPHFSGYTGEVRCLGVVLSLFAAPFV